MIRLIGFGRLSEAIDVAENALKQQLDPREAAEFLYQLSRVRSMQGNWKLSEEAIDRAMTLINGANPETDTLRAGLLERRAFVHFRQGKLHEARLEAESARKSLQSTPAAAAVLADLHNTLGGIAWWEGAREEAVAHVREAVDFYAQAGDDRGRANSLMNLGILLFTTGRWNEAASRFQESDRVRRDCGFLPGRAANLLNLGVLQMSMGDLVHARQSFDESKRLSIEAGEDFDTARAELGLAQVDLHEERLDDACARLDAAMAKQHYLCDDDTIQAEWLKALIECGRGGGDAAVDLASAALSHARKASLPETEIDSCIALGIASARCGRYKEAQDALLEAAKSAERLRDPYRRALALVELCDVCDRASGPAWKTDGRAHAGEAVRLFTDLGVSTGVDRAQTLLRKFQS